MNAFIRHKNKKQTARKDRYVQIKK